MNRHMNKRYTILVIVVLMLAALIAGCTTENTVNSTSNSNSKTSIVWQENYQVSFREPYPYSDQHSTLTGTATQVQGAQYFFDTGISETDREKALHAIESIIAVIKDLAGESGNSCQVYISNDSYPARAYKNQVYIGLETLDTQDSIIGIIQMLYGYQINYGLAYALSCDVADQMGISYEEPSIALADALSFVTEEPAYLDLNYACFSPFYADEAQLGNIKSLACHFYDFLCQADKLDIFSQYTDEKYCSYLNQFLSQYSALEYDNSGLADTIFFNGGTKTQMAWKNHVAEFYIEKGYTVTYYDEMFTEDMVNTGYPNLRKIVVDYIAQADYMQTVLQDFEVQTKDITVLFIKDSANSMKAAAIYMTWLNEIRMFSAGAFMHEYTHYLTEEWVYSWKCEVLPVYYGNYPVNEQITYMWYEDMLKRTSLDPNDPEEAEDYAFVQAVYASLDHEFNWTNMDDFQYLLDAYLVKRDWLHRITDPYGGVSTKSSFFHYLCKTYDENTAISAFAFDDPETYLGMSWEEAIACWQVDVRTRLAWVEQWDADNQYGSTNDVG